MNENTVWNSSIRDYLPRKAQRIVERGTWTGLARRIAVLMVLGLGDLMGWLGVKNGSMWLLT